MRLPALHWQIVIALALAAGAGFGLGDVAGFIQFCDFIGKFFLNGLKLLVVPLVLSAMIAGASDRLPKPRRWDATVLSRWASTSAPDSSRF